MTGITLGFIPEPLSVPVASILIEPLSVTLADQSSGQHVLLDGHLRLLAIQELGYAQAACLVATDDESYTYNNRVNRLSTIQEHYMIRRVIERGVSPERLAKALSVDVSQIIKRMSLLDGICPEAAELLGDRQFSPELVRALRKMKPTRQVECVELMVAANNVSVSYAEALLVATPAARLVEGKKPRKLTGAARSRWRRWNRR